MKISEYSYLNMALLIDAEFRQDGSKPLAILRFAAPYEVVLSGERADLARSWLEGRYLAQVVATYPASHAMPIGPPRSETT